MTIRKIVLLSLTGVLLFIYILQLVLATGDTVKTITLKENIQSIIIENSTGTIELSKTADAWVTENNLPVKSEAADYMKSVLSDIKVIDTVAKNPTEDVLRRYGLINPLRLTVTGTSGKTISSILCGKTSSTGNQTYIQYEGKKEIYLVSGNYNSIFGSSENDLLDLTLYSIKAEEIYKIRKFEDRELMFDLEKAGEIADFQWKIVSAVDLESKDAELDSEKILQWINSVLELSAVEWIEDFDNFDLNTANTCVVLGAAGKEIMINLYDSESESEKIICTCSENNYPCYISKQNADKFRKELSDFIR